MKKYFAMFFLILVVSCKTKSIEVTKSNLVEKSETDKIIERHNNNKPTFSYLNIKAAARYKDDKQTQSVTLEIRIKNNETIMVSIRFLGITMAKALITPQKVQYYDKINGKYFDGDYGTLNSFLGSDLDFYKIQNLFIGQAIDPLDKENYNNSVENKFYKLESSNILNTTKSFYFDEKYFIRKEIISQIDNKRSLRVNYLNFKNYPEGFMPSNILIETFQNKGNTTIYLDYNSVTFNEKISVPYSVPEGYEKIILN